MRPLAPPPGSTVWFFWIIAFPQRTIAHGVYIECWFFAREAVGRRYGANHYREFVHLGGPLSTLNRGLIPSPYLSRGAKFGQLRTLCWEVAREKGCSKRAGYPLI